MPNHFWIFSAAAIFLVSVSALAFDMASINYKVSLEGTGGSGNSSSANYNITQLSIGTVSNVSQGSSYRVILGVSMPEANDTFPSTCVTNSTSCASRQYNFSGFIFSGSGLAGSGTVTVSVKETGDKSVSTFSGGYFSATPQFCLSSGKLYTFIIQAESAGKRAAISTRRVANMPSENVSCSSNTAGCSFKTYPIAGWAMDYFTGELINNGTVRVSVAETGDTYSESFANGFFSIVPQFCLVQGTEYTFILSVEGGGKKGHMSYTRIGRG